MIKDPELISFWLIKSETGKIIEASNNLEGIIERARVSARELPLPHGRGFLIQRLPNGSLQRR